MRFSFLLIFSLFFIFSCDDCFFSGCDNGNSGSSDSPPSVEEYFSFETSSIQMNYFFQHVTIDGMQIESVDWIGAFHNNTCVGSLKWGDCVGDGDWCDVNIMGYNPQNELTQDYIHDGDYPSFMIYDASSNQYFDAAPSIEVSFTGGALVQIDSLSAFSD